MNNPRAQSHAQSRWGQRRSVALLISVLCLLTSAAIAQLRSPTDAALASAASLRNGLVSYWTLDEASGTRLDSVGTNHLTASGSVPAVRGKLGNSASNNASAIRLTTTGKTPDITGDLTVSLWYNLTTTNSTYQTIIAKDDGASGRGFYCTQAKDYASNAMLFSRWTVLGGSYGGRFIEVAPLAWTHIAIVYSGSNIFSYRNGTNFWASTTTNNNWVSVSTPWTVLAHTSPATFYLNGCVDEVGIWNRAITPAEVQRLYAEGRGSRWPFTVSPPPNP